MPKRICLTDVPSVYCERVLTEILPDTLVPFNDNGSGCVASIPVDFTFEEGGKYHVVFDREEYDLVYSSGLVLSNKDYLIFKLLVSNGDLEIYSALSGSHTIQLYSTDELVHKLPEKYFGIDSAQVAQIVKDEFAGGVGYVASKEIITVYPENQLSFVNQGDMLVCTIINVNLEIGETYNIIWDGTVYTCVCSSVSGGYPAVGDLGLWSGTPNGTCPFIIIDKSSEVLVVIGLSDGYNHILSITKETINYKKIDEKYLPVITSMIMKSSTEGSAKQFKITVDDSGTVTATAVT